MIPVNELRIGSWIEDIEGGQFQIEAINHDADGFECYYAVYRKGSFKTLCECIEPIALTPAVLERCGFDKVGSIHGEPEDSVKGLYIGEDLCIAFNKRTVHITSTKGKLSLSKIKIEHLHQLQNAVALTGAELNYKPI